MISIAFSDAPDSIAERKSKITLHRERKFQRSVTKQISKTTNHRSKKKPIIDRKHQLNPKEIFTIQLRGKFLLEEN